MSTKTQQLTLVNIVSVSEDKLQANFRKILNRLKQHDKLLAENSTAIKKYIQKGQQHLEDSALKMEEKLNAMEEKLCLMEEKGKEKEEKIEKNKRKIEENSKKIKKIDESWTDSKYQIDEELQVKNNEVSEINNKICTILSKVQDFRNSLMGKENRTEVEKVIKKIEDLHKRHHIIDGDTKLLQHKMEKIELLSQKAERVQMKKDAQLRRQIQETIKKQFHRTNSPQKNSSRESIYSPVNEERTVHFDRALSINDDDDLDRQQLRNSSVNMEKTMTNMSNKIITFESQMKELQQITKHLKELLKRNQNSSTEGFNEKINQLKSQMIKFWAKSDGLEDKLAFTERKMEEKGKIINNLVELQKQNHWGRLDDKLKTLQTEMYAFFKDVKSKIQGKLNTQDYNKNTQNIDNKIKQINDQIFLKSDKLEVKKALLFLESKIKQIILVISEDEENEKEALLTKKQLKCISCDKQVEKITGLSNTKGNWDLLPARENPSEHLGKFGMTNYGSLSKKLKKLENHDLPILTKKNHNRETHHVSVRSP